MATLEQQIAALTTAADGLTQEVVGKMGAIDGRVAAKELEVDAYLQSARGEASHFRLSKNQVLAGIGAVPDFWSAYPGVNLTKAFTVSTGVLWANRTAEEQALLTAMGKANVQYIDVSFDVWRMAWTTPSSSNVTMYQYIPTSVALTVGAMVKLESGAISGAWAEGAVVGKWVNTGVHYGANPAGYTHIHPFEGSNAGSLLVALPAAVTGFVDLTAKQWGKFPYIGDTYAI